jgi:hypothetical protein
VVRKFFSPFQHNKLISLRMQFFLYCPKQFCWNLINAWRIIYFLFPNSNLKTWCTGLWHIWLSCMHFILPNTPRTLYVQQHTEIITRYSQNLWRSTCRPSLSAFAKLLYVLTFLKLIYSPCILDNWVFSFGSVYFPTVLSLVFWCKL